jgi:ketosteroid isomerase-like protein
MDQRDDDLVARLLRLWDDVPEPEEAALAAFRELYADPVRINGTDMTVEQLVERARRTAAALAGRTSQVLSQVSTGNRTAVAFRMTGRHVGPIDTPLGQVPATGQVLVLDVIDLLMVKDGRISEIFMTADYLGALGRAGAVRLTAGPA